MYLLYRLHVAQDQVANVFAERLRRAVELGRQRRPSGGAAVTWSTSHGMSVFCDFMAVECLLKLSCVGRLTV